MVEVDLDHQHADDLFLVAHGRSKEVTPLARGGAQAEKAPQAPGHGFAEIRPEGEIAPDEAVVFIPVGGGQGLATGVHQVHHFGAGLRADIAQQAIGRVQPALLLGARKGLAQGRQVAEDLRQHFVAVQGAQQVGDVEVEGLAVLPGQFAAVIALGQMFERPQ